MELMGIITLLYAATVSEHNPLIMGGVVFAIFTIGKHNYYNPLSLGVSYWKRRLSSEDALYYLGSQCLAFTLFVISLM